MKLGEFKESYNKLRECKTIRELMQTLPWYAIEVMACIVLASCVFVPIVAMFYNYFFYHIVIDNGALPNFLPINLWHTLIQQIGNIGWVVAILALCKYFITEKVSVKETIKENPLPVFLGIMLLWSLISSFFAADRTVAFLGSMERMDGFTIYMAYAGVFACGYIIKNESFRKGLIYAFLAVSVLLCTIIVSEIPVTLMLFGPYTPYAAIFQNINHFGYYLCMSILCAFMLLVFERNKVYNIFNMLAYILCSYTLIKNNTFGSYLGVLFAIIFCIVGFAMARRDKLKRVIFIAAIFIVVTVVTNMESDNIVLNNFKITSSDIGKLLTSSIEEDESVGRTGSGRWKLWVCAVKLTKERPILGYGPDGVVAEYAKANIKNASPHNEFLQHAVNMGIPGVTFYILAILLHYLMVLKYKKKMSDMTTAAVCIMTAYLASSFFGNTLFYTAPYFFMMLGLSRINIITKEEEPIEEEIITC